MLCLCHSIDWFGHLRSCLCNKTEWTLLDRILYNATAYTVCKDRITNVCLIGFSRFVFSFSDMKGQGALIQELAYVRNNNNVMHFLKANLEASIAATCVWDSDHNWFAMRTIGTFSFRLYGPVYAILWLLFIMQTLFYSLKFGILYSVICILYTFKHRYFQFL